MTKAEKRKLLSRRIGRLGERGDEFLKSGICNGDVEDVLMKLVEQDIGDDWFDIVVQVGNFLKSTKREEFFAEYCALVRYGIRRGDKAEYVQGRIRKLLECDGAIPNVEGTWNDDTSPKLEKLKMENEELYSRLSLALAEKDKYAREAVGYKYKATLLERTISEREVDDETVRELRAEIEGKNEAIKELNEKVAIAKESLDDERRLNVALAEEVKGLRHELEGKDEAIEGLRVKASEAEAQVEEMRVEYETLSAKVELMENVEGWEELDAETDILEADDHEADQMGVEEATETLENEDAGHEGEDFQYELQEEPVDDAIKIKLAKFVELLLEHRKKKLAMANLNDKQQKILLAMSSVGGYNIPDGQLVKKKMVEYGEKLDYVGLYEFITGKGRSVGVAEFFNEGAVADGFGE